MLPDFAGMIAASPPTVLGPEMSAGVQLHHATDYVFHRTATFRLLSGAAARHFQSVGLRRGSALAVSHVGIELLIDCALGTDPVVCDDYLMAIEVGAPQRGELQWATLDERQRFARLHEVLTDRGLAVTDPAPDRLTQRLQRILAKRPRLALHDTDCGAVEAWARGTRAVVSESVPALLQELRMGLAGAGWGSAGERAAQ
jgi:hypothetical protein